jgi:hypothetical protein
MKKKRSSSNGKLSEEERGRVDLNTLMPNHRGPGHVLDALVSACRSKRKRLRWMERHGSEASRPYYADVAAMYDGWVRALDACRVQVDAIFEDTFRDPRNLRRALVDEDLLNELEHAPQASGEEGARLYDFTPNEQKRRTDDNK